MHMRNVQFVKLIDDVLTGIDRCLSDPNLPQDSAEWHQLYALRETLDDQQRELGTARFQHNIGLGVSDKIQGLNKELVSTLNDVQKVASTIATVTKIIGAVGQLLSQVHP
jgi:hypothetical protein